MQSIIKNKKGVSNLISTVLLILLATAAITTLGTQIFKLVNSPSLSPENSCPILLSKKVIQITKACYNPETGETEIILNKNDKTILINSLSFLLNEESFSCSNSCNSCEILTKDTKKYFFNKEAKQVSLFVNNCLMEQKAILNC